MPEVFSFVLPLLYGGTGNLAAYLAAHVLLCLLPAFFIAGAMAALIPTETVTRFLGRNSSKLVSYPAAAAAGSLLAVCSCTIVPLFAGIYKKGAGLGPAITFLFFAPAGNILALVYTGSIIGSDMALARLILSLVFGIGIGLIMALVFRKDDAENERAAEGLFAADAGASMTRGALLFLLAWVMLLLAGTLKLGMLTGTYVSFDLPLNDALAWQGMLDRLVPFDASKGEEGVSLQGVALITLLVGIGWSAWRGLENIQDGANRWTWVSIMLTTLTLLLAALAVQATPSGLHIGFPGKFFGVALMLSLLFGIARRLSTEAINSWLWESWRFVKQIFPLLVIGVFIVGMIRVLIQPQWIEALAGTNSLIGNLAGVTFGVFMYFPTLVEVPIARMFLDLGMHRGPLLAYLMSDPELSLQSILIIASIIGRKKAWTYVGLVALFSASAGMIYGAWVDGVALWRLALWLAVFIMTLAALLFAFNRQKSLMKGG